MDEHSELTDAEIGRLVALARAVQPGDATLERPPADLWSRIEAEIAAEDAATPPATVPTAPTTPAARPRLAVVRRHPRFTAIAATLAIAACIALGLVLVVTRTDDRGRELARISLSNEGLATFPVVPTGTARLVEDHGRLFVDVDVEDVPAASGYVELWLIDRQVQGMVSLGPYHGHDRYPVPSGVDPAAFPVVDVSLEPADGVPTHSGVSIVRGVLPEPLS